MAGVISDIFAPATFSLLLQEDALVIAEEATGIVALVESTIAAIQSTFLTAAYASAIPIIAIEFRGIVDVIIGIGQSFFGFLESLGILIPDFFDAFYTFITFLITNIICLARGIKNLPECIFFYLFNTFVMLLYLPIRLFLWFAKSFLKINLHPIQSKIWNFIKKINDIIFSVAGFDIIYWPDSIRKKCFTCKRLKIEKPIDKGTKLGNDIIYNVGPKIWPGIKMIIQGAEEIMNPFG